MQVIQLQGDQRKNVSTFLVGNKICKKDQVKIHGFWLPVALINSHLYQLHQESCGGGNLASAEVLLACMCPPLCSSSLLLQHSGFVMPYHATDLPCNWSSISTQYQLDHVGYVTSGHHRCPRIMLGFLSGMNPMISSRNCTIQQSSVNCRDQCVHRECHCEICRQVCMSFMCMSGIYCITTVAGWVRTHCKLSAVKKSGAELRSNW